MPSKASLPAGELAGRQPPDAFDDGVPVVDFAVLRMDHDVLHAGRRIGCDALPTSLPSQCERTEIVKPGSGRSRRKRSTTSPACSGVT
jgi:hypothetical protein